MSVCWRSECRTGCYYPEVCDLAVSLNVCPPCAQALHDLCTRALAPCDCPEHEGEA